MSSQMRQSSHKINKSDLVEHLNIYYQVVPKQNHICKCNFAGIAAVNLAQISTSNLIYSLKAESVP